MSLLARLFCITSFLAFYINAGQLYAAAKKNNKHVDPQEAQTILSTISLKILERDTSLIIDEIDHARDRFILGKNDNELAPLYYCYILYYTGTSKDSCNKYYALSLDLADRTNNDSLRARLYLYDANRHRDEAGKVSALKKAEDYARRSANIQLQAKTSMLLGNYFFTRDPAKCIEYENRAASLATQLNDQERLVQCMQNLAFTYDETLHDYPKAIEYVQAAITINKELKEVSAEANMLKYLGMLQGKLGELTEAKLSIAQAIDKFTSVNNEKGIAVCYFDMASAFEQVHLLDSAIYYLKFAKSIWEKQEDPTTVFEQRIFLINVVLMRIYIASNQSRLAYDVYSENKPYESSDNVHWQSRLDFYKLSREYFLNTGNNSPAKEYLTIYNALKDSLLQQSVIVQ